MAKRQRVDAFGRDDDNSSSTSEREPFIYQPSGFEDDDRPIKLLRTTDPVQEKPMSTKAQATPKRYYDRAFKPFRPFKKPRQLTFKQYIPKPSVETAAMPLNKRLKFTFVETESFNISTLTAPFQHREYLANTIFEPRAGIPCVGWLEWSKFYNRYRVDRATITLSFVNPLTVAQYVGVTVPPYQASYPSTWELWRAATSGNQVPSKIELLTPKGGCKDRTTLSLTIDLAKVYGMKKEYDGETDVGSSAMDSSPNPVLRFRVFVLNDRGALGSNVNIDYTCKIVFDTILYQRVTLLT